MGEEKLAEFNQWVFRIAAAEDDEPFSQAIALFPDSLAPYRAQALRLYEQGRYEECTGFIAENMARFSALTWNTEDLQLIGDIFYIEGSAWFELGEYARAAGAYSAAVANNPTAPDIHRDYAIALARNGNITPAEDVLTQMQDMAVGMDSIELLRGEIAYARGNNEAAIAHFHTVLEITNNDTIRRRAILIGERTYARMPGMAFNRTALLRQGLAILPVHYHTVLYHRLADALIHTGEYPEAIDVFIHLRAQGNISFTLAQNIGLLFQRTGDHTAAREVFTELNAQHPNDYRPPMRLAFLVMEEQAVLDIDSRNYREVLHWYTLGRELYGNHSHITHDDTDMSILGSLIGELRDYGWLGE
jgi:tetratricopeptide (TPR) repeat protein